MKIKLATLKENKPNDRIQKEGKFSALLQQEISFSRGRWSTKKKEQFFTELSVLLTSGIDLRISLELLFEENKKRKDENFYSEVYANVVKGTAFYQALQQTGKFTNYEIQTLKIGETTGNIGKVTNDLGEFCKKKNDQKRQLLSALTYPIIVIVTAMLVVFFMMNYVVPLFKDIFDQNNVQLPAITQLILNFSTFFSANFGKIGFLILLLIFVYYFLNKKLWFQRIFSNILIKIPLIGSFVKAVFILRFIQVMRLLSNSKVSITESLEMSHSLISFYPLKTAIAGINEKIIKGKRMSESFREYPIFDNRIITLLKVAEETNQTEFIFEKLYDQYSKELDYKSKQITNILNPILTLFIGAVVGIILIAMYLPMFKLSSVIN
ncbi:type II secretion system F family protein [Zunongwangia sp.]|uniref:type II secretion system F family protein n=1 Tax=Zunongwangia sp. TaxID=1965325 RepID=UPI003AA85DC3